MRDAGGLDSARSEDPEPQAEPAARSGDEASRDRILRAPLVGLLWSLSWPLAITGQVNMLTQVIAFFWIGNLLGTEALATLALLNPMFSTIGLLFAIPGVGSNILATQSLGAADGHALRLTLSGGALTGAMWLVLVCLVLPFLGPIADLIGGTAGLGGSIAGYIAIWLLCGLPLMQISDIAVDFANSAGWTRLSLVRVTVDLVIFLLLLPIFIDGVGFGLLGAPVTEAVVALALTCMILPTVWRRRERLGLGRAPRWREILDLAEWRRILALGAPSQASRLVMFALQAGWAWLIATEGEAALAGYGVTLTLITIFMLLTLAVATSNAIIVGQSIGAGLVGRARASTRLACLMALGLMAVLVIGSFFVESVVVRIITDDAQAIAAAEHAFGIMRYACFGNAVWQVLSAAVSAIGAPVRASIPTVLIEGAAFGVALVWPAESALTVMAIAYLITSIAKPLAMLAVLGTLRREG